MQYFIMGLIILLILFLYSTLVISSKITKKENEFRKKGRNYK